MDGVAAVIVVGPRNRDIRIRKTSDTASHVFEKNSHRITRKNKPNVRLRVDSAANPRILQKDFVVLVVGRVRATHAMHSMGTPTQLFVFHVLSGALH